MKKSLIDMRHELGKLAEQMRSMLDVAEKAKRGFTAEEKETYAKIRQAVTEQKDTIRLEEEQQALELEMSSPIATAYVGSRGETRETSRTAALGTAELRARYERDEPVFLGPEHRLSDIIGARNGDGIDTDRWLRGALTGRWKGAGAELRAMQEGLDTAGGFLVPEILAAEVIDLARAQTAAVRAGAKTVPMPAANFSFARVDSDPVAAWKGELLAATVSDMTFGRINLAARTLVTMCKMSVELAEDASNLSDVVRTAMSSVMALEIDRAALRGEGGGITPLGLINWAGLGVFSMGTNGAALTDFAPFSQSVEQVRTANGEPTAAIFHPRTAGAVDRLEDTTGQPLQPPASYQALQKFTTTSTPINQVQGSASNASDVIVGDFSQLLLGVRTDMRIEVSREAPDASGSSAFRDLAIMLRIYWRGDVAVARPSWFSRIVGVIP